MSSLWRPGGWRTEDHSLIRTADGAIHVWGEGAHGCLGHGEDLSNQVLPKKIEAWAPGSGAVM